MNISRNDPFDLNLCMRGLAVLITYLYSDVYEYLYYFTFKRILKPYAKEFNHAWEVSIEDLVFFKDSEDPIVRNCYSVQHRLIDYKFQLNLRLGVDEEEEIANELVDLQANRYWPYILVHKRAKSYKRLKLHYERALSGYIECLYLYACALTAQSYKIPLLLKKQLNMPGQDGLRLLNKDDNNVALLMELISELKKDLSDLSLLTQKRTSVSK